MSPIEILKLLKIKKEKEKGRNDRVSLKVL